MGTTGSNRSQSRKGILRRLAPLLPAPLYENPFVTVGMKPGFFALVISTIFLTILRLGGLLWSRDPCGQVGVYRREITRMQNLFVAHRVQVVGAPRPVSLDDEIPAIGLLYCAHPKDFDVLGASVTSALSQSGNGVDQVTIISPDPAGARRALEDSMDVAAFSFLDENDLFPAPSRQLLRKTLGPRYGWGLQQFLKLAGVLANPGYPTLVVDADTLILKRKTWIIGQTQLLSFRGFTNPQYFDFLSDWRSSRIDRGKSFVTHYQLVQPDILVEALGWFFGTSDFSDITRTICDSVSRLGSSDFALDYEVYGQFISRSAPRRFVLDKYSNLGIARSVAAIEAVQTERLPLDYNSVSFHHYLD